MLLQENLSGESLVEEIKTALADRGLIRNLENLHVTNATDKIIEQIKSYAR